MAKNKTANAYQDMAQARWSAVRDKADNQLRRVGMTQWNYDEEDRKQKLNDFSNYLNSGNYSVDNNQKYRDMATQAVADLDEQMKRYGSNSNERKLLNEYKNYYQNALPTFDRLDVGANVQDYLSYDQDKGFTNWHSQDDYNTQKSYLDQQRQAVQTELDAIEDQTSVDYQNLKSWQDQLDMYANALEERNTWDKQFEDVNDYTAYERAGDYKNSIQAKQTLADAQEKLKNTEADLKTLEMKFAGVDPAMGLTDQQMAEYNQMLQLQEDVKTQRDNVLSATKEVAGLEKWQKNTATYNLLSQYGEDADYEQVLNDLRAAREKTQEGTEDWAKIDLQIRALAGENENGLNENGQYDENTLYGRAVMRDFDTDAAQKRLDEIDQELKDLGVSTSRFWGGVTNADNNFGVDAAGMVYTDENAVGESDPRVMALRAEKTELTRKMNSAAKFQEKDAAEKAFSGLSEAEHNALQEAGLQHISQKGNTYYRDIGFDSTQSNGQIDSFRYLNDTDKLDALPEKYQYYADHAKEIRGMLVEALGAEALGKDIGYTVDDILRLYEGDINMIAGLLSAQDISAMDSDFARWNRQVLGVGTQAGLNQFATGMRQAFSDDYIEPNKTAYKAQFTREDLKRYGDEQIANGSNISQMLFDTTQTTANMLPMIAASYLMTKAGLAPVAGEIVGAGLMGLSSGGNTYQQALAEGWDKTDAKAYATILGAAEGTMQYLIGGIGALGGVGEEGLLKAAAGINNAAVRFATETGIHILSETTEELAQNRLQRYLDYKLGATDDADWMSWNDDDWYTVIVTALSTGAMEGLPGGINAVRNTKLGNQLAGNAIPGKAILKSNQARNEIITQIGEAMKGNEALHETLTTIGTNLMEEGSEAYDLAQRMESGKAAKSAWNYGVLYSEILSEYQNRNGKDGIEDGMAAVIGGAIKYHAIQNAETELEAANNKAEEVRKANPGSEVLSANATALTELGVNDAKQAQKYGALVNKVLSGTDLSDAEMNALVGDSTAAQAARVLIGRQNGMLKADTTAVSAKEIINGITRDMRIRKQQQKAANKMSVVQAAMEAANKYEVSRAAANADLRTAARREAPTWTNKSIVDTAIEGGPEVNWKTTGGAQDYVRADERRTIEKADADVEAAQARLDQLKKMSYKDMAALHAMGAEDTILEAAIDEDMTNEMAALQKRAEELNSVRFPSKEQKTQLADIRDRQAALKARMLDEYQRTMQRAEAARTEQQRNEESASIAAKTNDSVDTIMVGGARMTRDAFIQNHSARLMQSNPNLTQEQANEQALARYNELAAQTQKTEAKEEQKTEAKSERKSKVKPEKREVVRRQKLDGKAHYWTGGTLEGVQYGAVTEAEAEQAIGKTELDFVNNVLSKLVNVTLIKSLPGENGQLVGANGIFYRDGRIYLDINAGTEAHQRSVILTAAHELTHFIRTYNNKAYDKLRDFVESEMKQKGEDIEKYIKREQDNYKVSTGKELSRDKAVEEVVANACETMLTDANAINRFAAENPTEAKTILDWLTDFFQRIADAFEDLIAIHPEAKAMQDNINSLRGLWLNALVEADANAVKTTLDDHVKTEVNAEGEDVATTSDNGEAVFNLKTWREGGRTALEKFLAKRVKKDGLDQTQADEMLEQMDKLYDVCEEYDDGTYGPFSAWSNATVIMGKDGKPAFSVVKTNGEYALNLDFSLVCKKRRALDAVFNEMIERGLMNRVIGDEMFLKMYPASIVQINNYIREAGFETACALCFVDTKRYLQAMKADEFCSIYNGLVNSLIEGTDRKAKYFNYGGDMEFFNTWNNRTGIETLPDFELNWSHINEVLRTEKPTSTLYRMADYIKKNPEGRKLAARGDFMSTNGIDAMTIDRARLLELFHAKQGNSNAKDVVSDTPYFNEVIKSSSFTKEKAYSVGGVRIQSFSDYVGRLVFDYIQMVGDLAAKELPAHSYTKEYQFAMQFGKTGIKINMSLVPRVMEDGVAPGLDKDGNYAWMDGQSFGSTVYDNNNKRLTAQQGYELAIQIQNADGYSTNCGTIAVGVSDEHILKMLDDPNIRMIIPYHKSGINHLLAEMNQIGKYKDYTAAQNTRYFVENAKDGVDEITGKHGHWTKLEKGDFNWNDNLQRLEREGKGARECAQLYKDWCAARGYLPKFNDFAYHPNYYKVLEDFTAYDKDGATPAPLQGVQLNFPVEGDAFGSMQKLIQDGLQEDAVLQAKQDVGVKGIVDRIEAELPAWEAEFREKGDKFAIETSKASMAKTEMRDASFSLRNGEEATVYIKDGHRADGSTVDFINEILDGRKLGETRNHNRMTYGKWVGIGKDGQVLGRVKFGKPYQISRNSPEYADAMIDGTEYDLKDGEAKWYYPVVEKEDFRNNPKPITRNGNYGVYQVDGKSVTPEEAQASFSSRDAQYNNWAPEFYSKMANTIDEWTNGKGQPLPPKMSAQQVVGWLKGKGVKSEEIKWSGIIPYLEGKKTVTKEELQQVMAENEIKIETKVLGGDSYVTTLDWDDISLDGEEDIRELAWEKLEQDAKEYGYEDMLYDENGKLREDLIELAPHHNGTIIATNSETGEIILEARPSPGKGTHWGEYTLSGGRNYQEILFKQPGLGYSNDAMRVHWGDKDVIAHARVQDMLDRWGNRVLFVEEIQSDLHNSGASHGFAPQGFDYQKAVDDRYARRMDLEDWITANRDKERSSIQYMYTLNDLIWQRFFAPSFWEGKDYSQNKGVMGLAGQSNAGLVLRWLEGSIDYPVNRSYYEEYGDAVVDTIRGLLTQSEWDSLQRNRDFLVELNKKREERYELANTNIPRLTPDVPFAGSSDTYHEYVMKHMLRLAAEGDYAAIGWTTAAQQSDRWSDEYEEGYKIEYDQNIPKFMNKYGKQWGAKVGSTVLENGEEVWSVPVTEEMKKSVLETGQPLFSSRDTNAPDNSNPYPDKTLQHDILEHVRKGDLAQWLNEQKNAYDEALENSKERPPVIPAKGFVPRVTEKERQAIDNRNRALIQAKGAMRPSEKAANNFRMAKEDEKGNRFHRYFQNVITAEQTQPAWDQAKKFAFTDVAGTYVPDSNKADLKWANDVIHEDGRESAIKQFNRAAIAMDNSQNNITKNLALGQQLLIETSRDGDMQAFLDVLSSLTLLSSQAGKSLQAFRMLKQSGPIGELYYVEKTVKQLNERNAAKIQAGKMDAITIPEDFANAVLTAATEEEQDKAVDNLIAEIGKQVPVTLMDKWNAWRYLAMLGNARTHIRNLVGNAVFVPLRFAKDLMAAGGEFVLTKTGLMNEQDRRKALFVSKELKDFAKQDALVMQKELQGNGKYNPMREILDARRVLPGFLETLSRKNGQALEFEDWLFLSPAYQNALAQALAHTGYSIEEMLDGSNQDAAKALNRARVLAVEEAQKATYRDFNAAASMLNRIKRMETGKASDKALGILLEGILPFTKTPINILRRGVEYSPIGVASSIFEAAAKVKSGEFDMAEFIDHLSAGLTGSAVVVLGYLLSSLGYLRSKKDDKEEEFEKLQGYQDYSLQIGDVSATIDWAAPTALPLFTGAAIRDLMNGEDLEWKDAWDAMMMIAEPMMSLSMLDGLNNVLSSASYADDSQKLATVASSAFTSYIGQAFPTIAGQLARSMDGTRRATYVDKNSPVPSAIQRFVQSSIQNKTPIWEEQKIPYIDPWGREDTVNSKALGAIENFLSPSYINLVHTTDVDETLRELYDATKDSGVLPARIQNRVVKVNGEDRYLTADQFVDISRYAGTTKYTMLTQLFSDPRYMRLTDEQKAKAVAKVYTYANTSGKYYIWNDYNLHGQGKWMEEMYDLPTEIQRFNRFWEYLESYLKLD